MTTPWGLCQARKPRLGGAIRAAALDSQLGNSGTGTITQLPNSVGPPWPGQEPHCLALPLVSDLGCPGVIREVGAVVPFTDLRQGLHEIMYKKCCKLSSAAQI